MNVTMREIDQRRAVCQAALERLRRERAHPWAEANGSKIEDAWLAVRAAEQRVEVALAQYHAQPDCPFCRRAKMLITPTHGRLECDGCHSIALQGGMVARQLVPPLAPGEYERITAAFEQRHTGPGAPHVPPDDT